MSDTGAISPETMADDATVGTLTWSNPDNAKVSDNAYADSANTQQSVLEYSHYLKATNFGFSIPSDATITGILVGIERSGSGQGNGGDNEVRIVKSDGSIGTTNKSVQQSWAGAETYISFGGSSDLWDETWAYTDINDVDFGVVVSVAQITTGAQVHLLVDHIRITVYYIQSSFSPSISPSISPSLSLSVSPSVSFSVSPSLSPSISPSLSPSVSPSISLSPSFSPSVSPSVSLSPSFSQSLSPSKSPSFSPSISPSVSPSVSRSPSKSPSFSPSFSPSLSPSVSPSVSLSPSFSPSLSPSISPSVSPSVSLSPSKSPSISPSISPSVSPSVSLSPSISPSVSLSPSASPSFSPSASPSVSPSIQHPSMYYLNGVQLPSPKTFERDFIYQRTDYTTLSGKTTRDTSGKKEKYILSWENLNRNEVNIIKAIVELNTAVPFSVDEEDLQIASVSVIIHVNAINYTTPGSTYLAETELELIEVE